MVQDGILEDIEQKVGYHHGMKTIGFDVTSAIACLQNVLKKWIHSFLSCAFGCLENDFVIQIQKMWGFRKYIFYPKFCFIHVSHGYGRFQNIVWDWGLLIYLFACFN